MTVISQTQYLEAMKKGYNTIPLIEKLSKVIEVAAIYEAFCPDPEQGALLETGRAGKYSYVAFSPIDRIQSKNGEIQTDSQGKSIPTDDPLQELQHLMENWKSPTWTEGPDWQGGALGYLSYDMVQHIETIPHHAHDDLQLPDLIFTVYRDVIAIDHENLVTYLITNVLLVSNDDYEAGYRRLKEMKDHFKSIQPAYDAVEVEHQGRTLSIKPSFTKEKFEQAVREVQEYIGSGDVFQVNLSVRQDFPISASPWDIYKTLRKLNPSPYMGYLHYPKFQVVSGSPELLIKIKDRKISTRPIAGTRSRGQNREEDLQLARELIENEKERAEHIMLVDLERNDLGRVCQYGTVQVTDLMVIEEYSHVMHIVSHVEGTLANDKTGYDAIRACFPGGTITGAPKIRTMEIIEELEPVKRGLYTGSIGWIGFNGDMELNIVIRTMIAQNGLGHVQAGAGIVIDSKPEAEYYESLKKAEAMLKSVELSQVTQVCRVEFREER